MPICKTFHPPARLLLGPGPSNVGDRVLRAMSAPVIGYFDPAMAELTSEIQRLLNTAFGTRNRATFTVSGTGSAGMEAALINMLEPGDRVAIGLNGFFGDRMLQIAERCGAVPVKMEAEWGRPIAVEQVREALRREPGTTLVAVVHAETSTGVLQPLAEIGEVVRQHGGFFLVDAVTSLAGHPVEVDRSQVDVCYAGTQKAVAAPPGLAPLTFSDRAVEHVRKRRTRVQSYYLDIALFEQYWGTNQFYHHTPPVNFYYALLEALRMVEEEGLKARFERHRVNHLALVAGLEAMGLRMHVEPAHRLWTLNTVRVPDGIDEAAVRRRLVEEFGIEIGGGLGTLKGKIWRIGLMGVNSVPSSVLLLLTALERILPAAGFPCGSGITAANEVYQKVKN
jgi:alanine-glyoxylate transaminase/serine-glyoxylate transaminase/serine-pyruvate transaminase